MIKLDDVNYIETDRYNFILVMHKANEMGKVLPNSKVVKNPYSQDKSYYGTLEQALNAYVQESVKDVDGSLKDVLDLLYHLKKSISILCAKECMSHIKKGIDEEE